MTTKTIRPPLASSFVGNSRTKRTSTRTRTVETKVVCQKCNGHGGIKGGCTPCEGTGWVVQKSQQPIGTLDSMADAYGVSLYKAMEFCQLNRIPDHGDLSFVDECRLRNFLEEEKKNANQSS